MYCPKYLTKESGVPILSKVDQDAIAENFIRDYSPEALRKPRALDIDGFAFNYLGLKLDFQHLSHDESILGAMVFQDTSIPIYVPEEHRARYFKVQGGTIIVDRTLGEINQENRYRYTVGHETSHAIFHEEYFKMINEEDNSLDNSCHVPHYQGHMYKGYKPYKRWTSLDWVEWQANYFAAALLMPKTMVYELIRNHSLKNINFKEYEYVHLVSKTFQVSWEAAANRLKSLRVISNVRKVIESRSVYVDFIAEA